MRNRPGLNLSLRIAAIPLCIALCPLAGCEESTAGAADDLAIGPDLAVTPPDLAQPPDLAFMKLVTERPYKFKVPAGYDPSKPTPLLVLLHGYMASGQLQDTYFGLSAIVDKQGFLYAFPDGKTDGAGQRFWNATDACCDLGKTGVDDVAYVNAIIDDMSFKFNVDPKRIFLAGHSNGGFMSHRMACDAAPRIAAIMALAGDNWKDATKCQPASPVNVLQVHGTSDAVINYNGGSTPAGAYPSARDSVLSWVAKNGCSTMPTMGTPLDLERGQAGDETTVEAWTEGCKPGGAVELWTIKGGSHIPSFQADWSERFWTWLAAHPKP